MSLEKSETPFKKGVVLVCADCSKQFDSDLSQSSNRIKTDLKLLTKENFGKDVRVVTSSCLALCPENKVAICSITFVPSNVNSLVIAPDTNAFEIFNQCFKD